MYAGSLLYSRTCSTWTEKRKFVVAVAIGDPDPDAPVNRFPRTRIPVDEFLRFVR